MNKKRSVVLFLLIFLATLSLISFSSAGVLGDWYSRITGKATSGGTSLNITIGNNAPTITHIFGNLTLNPSEGGVRIAVINFTANDADGAGNLNTTSARINITRSGEVNRYNTSCVLNSSSGNQANFTCIVQFYYFDGSGTWNINASIKDVNEDMGLNTTENVTLNLLTSMVVGPAALSWPEIGLVATNTMSDNDPLLINNTGNDFNLNINVTAYNLEGEVTTDEYIYANNFSVENIDTACTGTNMANATSLNITSTILQRGNNSINAGDQSSGQEQLYFCLEGVPQDISSQSYSSAEYGNWNVQIIT